MAAYGSRTRDLPEAPPRNDVYVGLLLIALIATLVGCLFLYLDYSQYPDTKPPPYTPAKVSPVAPAGPTPTPNRPPNQAGGGAGGAAPAQGGTAPAAPGTPPAQK